MREFVQQQNAAEHDAWFRRQVQLGLNEANAGHLIPAAEVEAEADNWRTKTHEKMVGVAS